MMGDAYARPRKMVSHCWDNLFRDLVAACVSDALDDCEFSSIAQLLDRNLDGLVSSLRAGGGLGLTYWIC
eukprot:15937155-Heterocapsa_arctica.AAC.1